MSFILGTATASFLSAESKNYNLFFFAFAVIFSITAFIAWMSVKVRLASLIGVFLFLGIWRFLIGMPEAVPDKIWFYNRQEIEFNGIIAAPPDVRKANQKLTVEAQNIAFLHSATATSSLLKGKRGGAASAEEQYIAFLRKVSGKVLITAGLYPVYHYGDILKIECKLQAPEKINGFAYDKYLARHDIYSLCYYPEIIITGSGSGNVIYSKMFALKNRMVDLINKGLTEPSAGLASAIMFGDRRGLPQELLDVFSQTGTTHIMAISGMNITILAALALQFMLLAGFNRKQAFYLSIALLFMFIIMVGAPASAMRAGVMGFLVLWALKLGRLNKITNSIVLAGAIMLLFNPKLLRYDIGFQLSFLAILGLVYVYPIIENGMDKLKAPKLKGGRQVLSMTLAAQIFTLPVTASNFGIVSLVAPLPNLLILWTIPILTVMAFAAIFLSALLPAASLIFFAPTWLILKYIITVCIWTVELPLAYVRVEYVNIAWLIIYYIFWLGVVFYFRRREAAGRRPVALK